MRVDLRLPHPPTAEWMPEHATTAVTAAARVDGVELDYSVPSLHGVDGILGRFYDDSPPTDWPEVERLTVVER